MMMAIIGLYFEPSFRDESLLAYCQHEILILADRIQDNVFGLRYRSSQYDNMASSLWPCQKHYFGFYINKRVGGRDALQHPIILTIENFLANSSLFGS
jgi:hypothetical protein